MVNVWKLFVVVVFVLHSSASFSKERAKKEGTFQKQNRSQKVDSSKNHKKRKASFKKNFRKISKHKGKRGLRFGPRSHKIYRKWMALKKRMKERKRSVTKNQDRKIVRVSKDERQAKAF